MIRSRPAFKDVEEQKVEGRDLIKLLKSFIKVLDTRNIIFFQISKFQNDFLEDVSWSFKKGFNERILLSNSAPQKFKRNEFKFLVSLRKSSNALEEILEGALDFTEMDKEVLEVWELS